MGNKKSGEINDIVSSLEGYGFVFVGKSSFPLVGYLQKGYSNSNFKSKIKELSLVCKENGETNTGTKYEIKKKRRKILKIILVLILAIIIIIILLSLKNVKKNS
jgi:predicted nucleic acid-binding Zn ribbon protein